MVVTTGTLRRLVEYYNRKSSDRGYHTFLALQELLSIRESNDESLSKERTNGE